MKLYVVNAQSGNPEEWDIFSEYSIVLASNKEEAVKLCGIELFDNIYYENYVHEVPTHKPVVLFQKLIDWGEDL